MAEVQEPLVSICCITYNHEKYIKDTIESFLMQKTDFSFEIIIHDDASTDMTANIIREYEKKYPKIVKPIYQTENQYSKGIRPAIFTYERSRGKYIALCEGDDYWIDSSKLQKQIDEMEKHPECYISFHPAIVKWEDGSKKDKTMCFYSKKNKTFTVEEVILGDGGFMPTNSIIVNRTVTHRIISFFNVAKEAPIGDYYLQILGSENGGALYIKDIMSVYRARVQNSWSTNQSKHAKNNNSFLNLFIATNNKMNEFTGYTYSDSIIKMNKRLISKRLKIINVDVTIRKNIFDSYSGDISFTDKILWHTIFRHPKRTKIISPLIQLLFREGF